MSLSKHIYAACTGIGPSRNIIANVTETSVELRWTAPRGLDKQRMYKVQLKDVSHTLKWLEKPSATFANLSAGTTYTFVVEVMLGETFSGVPVEETFTTSKSLQFVRSTFILSTSNKCKGV